VSQRAVAVFAKAPVPGTVKTRLAGRLDPAAAARLQQTLTTLALKRARALPDVRVELWIDGPLDHPFLLRSVRDLGISIQPQRGEDLGSRMAHAIEAMLAHSSRALVIGTDCPAQRTADLEAAFAALDKADAVVQPAEDGGYVLIGMKRCHAELFRAVPWGTDQVMPTTRARAASAGIQLAELPLSWDLDRPADFERALALGLVTEQ
jgi:uncharacterized protein